MTNAQELIGLAAELKRSVNMHGSAHMLRLARLTGHTLMPVNGPVVAALVGKRILVDRRENEPDYRRRMHGAVARALAQALLRRRGLPVIAANIEFLARELLIPRAEFERHLQQLLDAERDLDELERIYRNAPIAWILERLPAAPVDNVVRFASRE